MAQQLNLAGKVEVTPDLTVRKLRELVQPAGRRGTWLRHLNNRQLTEVYQRLKLGHQIYHIAKVAQREWGILPNAEIKSLTRALRKFRQESLGLLQVHEQSFPRTPEKTEFVEKEASRGKRIVNDVDAMDKLGELIKTLDARVKQMISRERTATFLPETVRTAKELRESINTFMHHAETLGLVEVKPRQLDLNLKTKFDGLLAGAVSDDGSRLIHAANRLLEAAEQKSLIMQRAPDGSYHVDDDDGDEAPGEAGPGTGID